MAACLSCLALVVLPTTLVIAPPFTHRRIVMFNIEKVCTSSQELHHKAARRAQDRRVALTEWRAERTSERELMFVVARRVHLERRECARFWHLARAFVLGVPYLTVERKTHTWLPWLAQELAALLVREALDGPAPTPETAAELQRQTQAAVSAWMKEPVAVAA
jgi:hypothetical protein